ncbi:MAG: GNAT family N-acetyltransferase [Alphaproteobacteria bacterium]|nr:GNAT family N-acetyltransferase [Alphaproteobacteria bacterium]
MSIITEITELENEMIIADARILLAEYGNYMYKDLKLNAGKKSFYKSLKFFPDYHYIKPQGNFWVIYSNKEAVACIGMRKFDVLSCEMKRMYVKPLFRKKGIGSILITTVLEEAKKLGFVKVLLDTNEEMIEAVNLYKNYGFTKTMPYCENENPHVVYFEYIL